MLKQLSIRQVPELLPREKMLHMMLEQVYGFLPEQPDSIQFEVSENYIPNFCAGKASCSKVTANCVIDGRAFSFPFYATLPTDGKKHPFFVHINFRPDVPDRYQPTEELIDHGFAVLSFCYHDVTRDDNDFTDGLAGVLYPDGKRACNAAGKIAM